MRKPIVHYRCFCLDVRIDYTEKVYGKLKTVGPTFWLPVGKQGRKCEFQVVQCQCNGEYLVKRVDDMKSGRIVSCGCARNIHGCHNKPETGYKCWESMLHRCKYTEGHQYRNHGAIGITVCDRWKEPNGQGFINFITDMGPRPSLKHSIDRYPNRNGNYEPGNCRWATQKEQMANTRRNIWIEYNGETKLLGHWAEQYGINSGTLYCRIFNFKWPVEKALTTPVRKRKSGH